MQKVQLTKESDNTIHVDEVSLPKDGIIETHQDGDWGIVIQQKDGCYRTCWVSGGISKVYIDLKETMIKSEGSTYKTLDGKQIVTEKSLTVDDLKDDDHVGFVTAANGKGYIQYVGDGRYLGVYKNGSIRGDEPSRTFKSALIKDSTHFELTQVFKAKDREELFKWLAE